MSADTPRLIINVSHEALVLDVESHRAMTPLHPQWPAFLAALRAALGGDSAQRHRRCSGFTSLRAFARTKPLLAKFECDVLSSLLALNWLSGQCDCTILFEAGQATPDMLRAALEQRRAAKAAQAAPRIPRTPIRLEDAR